MKGFAGIVVLLAVLAICSAELKAKSPITVSYDHRALLLNGTRRLLVSGSIHYPRSSPGMWNDILQRSKDAGIDVVQIYVHWNFHQPSRDEFFFGDNANIFEFLDAAQAHGLYVNLRIGPFICAEWTFGGLPYWLLEDEGIVFRDYSAPWMKEMAEWMTFFVDLMRPYMAPNGGPIILAQVENEYGWLEKVYGASGTAYRKWAINFARSLDIGVPWIMCAQNDEPLAINTCNGFYCDDWIQEHITQFPDQPSFFTENWPGWFQHWGEPTPKRPTQDVAYSVASWFAKGGSLHNYYMWHGGTTFGRWVGGPWIITSYDYDVALDEYGFPRNPKYGHLKQLHGILHENEDLIVGNDIPSPVKVSEGVSGWVYEKGVESCEFVVNSNVKGVNVSWKGKDMWIPAWSVTILATRGAVNWNSAVIQLSEKAPNAWNEAARALTAGWWPELIGGNYSQVITNDTPLEQLSVTKDKTDYLWYDTQFSVEQASTLTLSIQNINDFAMIYVDGNFQGTNDNGNVNLDISLTPGTHTLQILSSTMGLWNIGEHMEAWKRGIQGSVTLGSLNLTASGWNHHIGLLGEQLQLFTNEGQALVNWNSNLFPSLFQSGIWYKMRMDVSKALLSQDLPFALNLTTMGKGYVFVNGRNMGRYWNITAQGNCSACNYTGTYHPEKCRVGCGEPSQALYHVPRDYLKEKDNLIVLFEELGGNPQGVRLVVRNTPTVCGEQAENWPREDSQLFLECEPNQVVSAVNFASFGTPTGYCGEFSVGECNAESSVSVVESMCMGLSACSIPVSIETFGDPCPGVSKTLAVQLSCSLQQ